MAFAPKKGVMKKGIKGGGLPKIAKAAPIMAEPDGDEAPGGAPFKRGGKVGKGKKC